MSDNDVRLTPEVIKELHALQIDEMIDDRINDSEELLNYFLDKLEVLEDDDERDKVELKFVCNMVRKTRWMVRTFKNLKA